MGELVGGWVGGYGSPLGYLCNVAKYIVVSLFGGKSGDKDKWEHCAKHPAFILQAATAITFLLAAIFETAKIS